MLAPIRSAACIAVVAVAACTDRPAEPPPRPLPAPPTTPTSAPDASARAIDAAAPVSTPIRFEPAPTAVVEEPSPHVEIQFPFAEQVIRADKAKSYKLRLKVEHWPVGKDGRGVDLILDDFRPRRVESLDPPIELGALVPEDATLAPGEHTLVAVAVRENGQIVRPPKPTSLAPWALVHFWIGEKGASRVSPSAPRIVYVAPRGTINGEAASERILLDFLALGVELGRGKTTVVVRVQGDGASGSTILERWQPLHLLDVPSGDFDVQLELVGPDGKPLPGPHTRAARTITVNRDAPVPQP